jgi:hypothetical protein
MGKTFFVLQLLKIVIINSGANYGLPEIEYALSPASTFILPCSAVLSWRSAPNLKMEVRTITDLKIPALL